MRRPQGAVVRVDEASSASVFRELDDAFLQKQTKIWLGEVLHLRFDEDILVADLLADGELLFQVSKVIWKRLLKKNREQLKQSKVCIYEKPSFGNSNGKYMPYSKVDSFLKICQGLGLAGIDLFTPSDVVEKRNVRKVCICIRSLSKKSCVMHLNVPDFDIVTYTISMPNYVVGVIRRNLEQPQFSSSGSSGYSPHADSNALQRQLTFGGQSDQHSDTHYDSDEAESRLSVLEPEDSVDEGKFGTMRSQLSDGCMEESEGYGKSRHEMHEEKSLLESVGSLNFGVMDSDFADSTPSIHNEESYCSTTPTTDRYSRTRTRKCPLSSEESDSICSHLPIDIAKRNFELDTSPVMVSERNYDGHAKHLDHSIQANEEMVADHHIEKGRFDLQMDSGTINRNCDALTCDRESVCSSSEEPMYGNGEPPNMSLGLSPRKNAGGKLPMVSKDQMNNVAIHVTEMANDIRNRELDPEFSTINEMVASQSADEPLKSEDVAKNSITPPETKDDAPKSGKGVLKSVAGGITLVGAVFFIIHLRRSKGSSFTTVRPLPEKSIGSDSRAQSTDKGKAATSYPGEWLKV